MVYGIFCMNSNCKHYYEDNCMFMFGQGSVSVSEDGMCKTFEKGKHEEYEEDKK